MSRSTRSFVIGSAVLAVTAATLLPVFAGDDDGRTLRPVADTTVTQVPQDGDTSGNTTLASCPALCEGNPQGRRDATLQFAVDRLPAGATQVRAIVRVYTWQSSPARILVRALPGDLSRADSPAELAAVRSLQVVDQVAKGYNDFDVSAVVQRNGTYTVALSQENHSTRVYWASRENVKEELRPELLLSWRGQAEPADDTAQDWRLVFSDEFTGTALDRAKWNLRNGEGRSVDLGCNVADPANTFVSGGNLTLRALRRTVACGSQTRQYTQSYLDTMGRASFTYGRFEIRAKSPTTPTGSQGLWPAFWLRPDDGGNGEIDVTELPGGAGWHDKSTAAIFWDYTPVKQDTRIAVPGGGHPADGFHTYVTEWDAKALRWYIDGKLVWTRDGSTTPWFGKAFARPYNLRLNFQVGGWLGAPDAATRFPADFVVDYVRVYQR